MVAYSDVPAINTLYQEQSTLNTGIALVDAGGTVSSFTLIPPPPDPGQVGVMMMSATVGTIDPTLQLMTAIRDAMVRRNAEIDAELLALGVEPAAGPTSAPPEQPSALARNVGGMMR